MRFEAILSAAVIELAFALISDCHTALF